MPKSQLRGSFGFFLICLRLVEDSKTGIHQATMDRGNDVSFHRSKIPSHPLHTTCPSSPQHTAAFGTDAGKKVIVGMVHQVVDGQEQPLPFYSRRTTAAESRYSAYNLELLAIYSSILHFRHILEYEHICIDQSRPH